MKTAATMTIMKERSNEAARAIAKPTIIVSVLPLLDCWPPGLGETEPLPIQGIIDIG